ncbi:hypothetical protein HOY80DRAFT_703004 [Tuber brumale]|nr:hypothetical protein HOY80DRAFT_703004 [Tuber brumale]
MSQNHQPQPASTIQRKSSHPTAGLLPRQTPYLPSHAHAHARANTASALVLGCVTPGSLLGIYNSKGAQMSAIPTGVESRDSAKAHGLQTLSNLLTVESSNSTAEPDTDGPCAVEEATICRIPGNLLTVVECTNQHGDDAEEEEEVEVEVGEEEEGEGQNYTNDSSSLDSVAFSYLCRLSAHVDSLTVSGRPHQKPDRPRRQQRLSRERRDRTNISANPADLTSRITDWIPPPPELPVSPKLLDPVIAAAYPLPRSRACSEPTPSSQQPPYQLPPYPTVPRSTASSSLHGTRLGKPPRPKVSPSLASSATTDVTWGSDSPLTSALRLKRATAISALPPSSPMRSVSSQDSSSTGVTGAEAELGVLEEAGRKEVLRQRVLLWRLIAGRDGGSGEIGCSRSN